MIDTTIKITMADHLHSKSSKYIKKGNHSKQPESSHSKLRKTSISLDDVKTPPLPSKNTIEELLKKRKTLKEELEKIENLPDTGSQKKDKVGVHKKSNDSSLKQSPSKKRCVQQLFDKYVHKGLSPEKTVDAVDSDNEEYIIDQRRKKRKQLLEKLGIMPEKKAGQSNKDIIANDGIDSDNEEYIIEQRRKKRKQLLEKLGNIPEKKTGQSNMEIITNDAPKQPFAIDLMAQQDSKKQKTDTPDMFSETDDFNISKVSQHDKNDNHEEYNINLTDNWDDTDGYYKISIGDTLNYSRYRIKNILGQGMFANVVNAFDREKDKEVAIKIARSNDIMYANGLKEITMLKELCKADPENKYNCVKFLRYFMHRGHLCIVLESLNMDLRCVLKKLGKSRGINMKQLLHYSSQLLTALTILEKVGIIHADIKPDNILVNEKKNILKLCDFGSAEKLGECDLKPYLVSRFYRAPEIIMGLPYGHGIDLWSAACTIYETATGRILFTGGSNNKMLKCFMDLKGKIPKRMIKQGKFKDQHFNYNNNFLLHKKDEVTGRDKVVEVSNIAPTRNLYEELKKYCNQYDDTTQNQEKKIAQLKELLEKMLMLDQHQRPTVADCLRCPLFTSEIKNK